MISIKVDRLNTHCPINVQITQYQYLSENSEKTQQDLIKYLKNAKLSPNILFLLYLPPPFLPQRYGNLQTFPRPMAYPMQDNRKSNLPFQVPRSGMVSLLPSRAEVRLWFSSSNGTACLSSDGELSCTVLSPVFPMAGSQRFYSPPKD